MLSFFIVNKFIMLGLLLLASIFGLHAYEFGYHPSAEEFDSLLRETRKTWTRDLIANEHRRSWTVPSSSTRNDARNFVPKYNYESARNRYPAATTDRPWPGYAPQTLAKPEHNRHDQQSAASNVFMDSNIGSSIDFTLFSDENSDVPPTHIVEESAYPSFVKPYGIIVKPPRPTAVQNSIKIPSAQQSFSAVNEIDPNASETNDTETHLPIFFTNPVTGIVYAITEVGKLPNNISQSNDSIPIYVTKEQYDRDLFQQRKRYENGCQLASNKIQIPSPSSAISVSSNTTVRPQIIRLQKPLNTISKLPLAKLPAKLHKPPPVMVQSEVTVSDHVNLPPKRKKKPKTKKKKNKRPGRKPTAGVAVISRPPLISGTAPQIVIGTRTSTVKPSVSTNKLSTQLEKPSVSTTVFSNRPFVATSGYMSSLSREPSTSDKSNPKVSNPYPNHRIIRRSLKNNTRDVIDLPEAPATTKDFRGFHKDLDISWRPFVKSSSSSVVAGKDTIKTAQSKQRSQKNRRKLPKNGNRTSTNRLRISKRNQTNTLLFAGRSRHNSTSKPHNSSTTTYPKASFLEQNTTVKGPGNSTPRSSVKVSNTTESKKSKKKKRRKHSGSDFDLFNLDDDDDYDDDSYDDSYYDDDDDEKVKRPSKTKKNKLNLDKQDVSIDSIEGLKEDVTTDNSSSAEEGADFGAMVEEPEIEYNNDDATEESMTSATKNTSGLQLYGEKTELAEESGKKRIRRRPQGATSTSYEDYDGADDDDDDYADSGMGAFFRMLFYPVQLVMNRLFDGAGDNSAESDKPKYPTYTLYNNAVKQLDSEEDDDQSNSLSSWLSSWFGYNRRTKKIGSTTVAPPPLPQPVPTEEPGWFESWFGYGKTTTEASAEDYNDYDKWFFGWFDTKPKARRRRTTTTTTTPVPQIPILTIVDPMRNPQNWIGILASHFNATASLATTHNPLIQAITRATTHTTTTENPDIPRKISYEKYQIWRLKPQDDTQVKSLEEYKRSDDGARLQWLKGPSLRGLTDVLVSPKMLIDFRGSLNFEAIAYEVLIFDVGKAIAYETTKEQYYFTTTKIPRKQQKRPAGAAVSTMSWHKYHEFDDIVKYLEAIRMRHPQIVELIHIGRSYEGRPLVIVKIELKQAATMASALASDGNRKKLKYKKKSGQASAVFLESGAHGTEWIGPATSTWIINELLRIMKSNRTDVEYEFIKNTTWYIMPVLNPDGYVYSHEYDRFWKKSRSRHTTSPSLITSAMTWLQQKKAQEKVCYGVDLDRNWHYQWSRRGSSKSACNELFAGPAPFSEPETKALSEFLMDSRKQIKLYISMQAYGQIISYPVKLNASFNSERMDDFFDVAMVGTDGLRKKGSKSRYKIDSSSDLIESRSGCADAFAAYEVGIPFSYTLHLADNGVHGYLLPSSAIEPTARDAFEVITTMLDYI